MNTHDLLVLVALLVPGILLSILILVTFAAGG
jgi:ABC-type microcin C transport system permease subunit YejB